jgi:hypothetical protein
MPVGTYLYLHAVGVGNPVAVPCLARHGLNEVPAVAIRGISNYRQVMYGGFLEKHNIRTLANGSRLVRYVFSETTYSQIISRV